MASDEGIKQLGKDRYQVRVKRVEKRTGRQVNRKVIVQGTKAEARRVRDELRDELASTQLSRPRIRLFDYATSWLERRASELKPSVVRKYGNGIAHLKGSLGELYVDGLSPADVADYLGRRTEAGYAGNTVLNELRLLRTIAKDSVAEGYASKYWCDRVKPPRVTGYTRDWLNLLSAEQVTKLMAEVPKQWRGIVMLMATTGLRWGEASALHWEDVDLELGEALIRWGNDHGVRVTVKTKSSNRIVPILPEVASLWGLRRDAGLVFPTRAGKLHHGSPLRKVLDQACERAKVPRVTAHGLRRTFNNLARQTTSREVLKSITGHTTDAMVEHYSHVGTPEKTMVSRALATSFGVLSVSSDKSEGDGK